MASSSSRSNRQHQCLYCGQTLGKKRELTRHVREQHTDSRHSCPATHCRYSTPRLYNLRNHLSKKHHRDGEEERETGLNYAYYPSQYSVPPTRGRGIFTSPTYTENPEINTESPLPFGLYNANQNPNTESSTNNAFVELPVPPPQYFVRSQIAPEHQANTTPAATQLSTGNSPEHVESPSSSWEDHSSTFTHWMKMMFDEDWDITTWKY